MIEELIIYLIYRMTMEHQHINVRIINCMGAVMRNIGVFWGVMAVILTIGSIMRFVAVEFYNIFISGLSKKSHKRLVNKTINVVKTLEEDHGIFAFGSSISILFHAIIMISCDGVSILGSLVGIIFLLILFAGLIYRYIYSDKLGRIKKYHILFALLYIIFLILHIRF